MPITPTPTSQQAELARLERRIAELDAKVHAAAHRRRRSLPQAQSLADRLAGRDAERELAILRRQRVAIVDGAQ